jgi:hypothetical protein
MEGVGKKTPVPYVSMSCLFEPTRAVPMPKYASTRLCAESNAVEKRIIEANETDN